MPAGDYLHSGSLVDALSLGAPVIAASTPFSRGLKRDVGDQWVHLYEGDLTASDLNFARPQGRPDLALYELPVVASDLVAILQELIS